MNRRPSLRLLLFIAASMLLALPGATAQEQTQQEFVVTVPGLGGDSATVTGYHQFPIELIPKGGTFYVTSNLFSDDSDFDVEVTFLEQHGGCAIDHVHSDSPNSQSESLSILMTMENATTCSWHIIGNVTSGATLLHQFHMTGNVASFRLQDQGQTPDEAGVEFWVPTALLIGAALLGFAAGWDFVGIFGGIGVLNQFFEVVPMSFEGVIAWLILGFFMEYMDYQTSKYDESDKENPYAR